MSEQFFNWSIWLLSIKITFLGFNMSDVMTIIIIVFANILIEVQIEKNRKEREQREQQKQREQREQQKQPEQKGACTQYFSDIRDLHAEIKKAKKIQNVTITFLYK